ncbi:UvrB/UvrC motif-containing protein [Caloranaerobacter azorensis]|uniref:UVR domain-containing protein n=1 Tax=Caloranaerobacter azorensis TaxID=116090 RepID=A0A6P1YCX4_9FIRM|nr:UvrB/UvrC motif-containing protein [Caloranaerobacter azorensis]QIB27179.1 hypothetical protein G3A45_07685 [Caloranaerobacter azorensis]
MLCDDCGKREATMHFTKIINGDVTELHLCEECAKNHKEFDFDASFSIHNFLAGLLDLDSTQESPFEMDYITSVKCEKCGLTYSRFRQIGKFGCSNCYNSFREKLIPLFRRIHGHENHVGKVPRRAGGMIRIKKEISRLKKQLELAVRNEEYEKAAKIRDQIKELQAQIDTE